MLYFSIPCIPQIFTVSRMKTRIFLPAVAALLAALCAAGALGQQTPKLYKWVDKNGVVHYGSSVPPEYANQKLDVLNSEGIVVKKVSAQKTPQELAKEEQEKAAAAQREKAEKLQQLNDQMLLDTYTSVADIKRDRNSRLAAMESQINVTKSAINGLQNTVAEYQERMADLKHAGKPVPPYVEEQLDKSQRRLVTDQKLLLQQQQQKQDTQTRFTAYIKRFRQLTRNPVDSGGN